MVGKSCSNSSFSRNTTFHSTGVCKPWCGIFTESDEGRKCGCPPAFPLPTVNSFHFTSLVSDWFEGSNRFMGSSFAFNCTHLLLGIVDR